MDDVTINVALTPELHVTWHKRLLNLIIDYACVMILFIIAGFVAGLLTHLDYFWLYNWFQEMTSTTDRIVTTLIMSTYIFIMEVTTQRTIGKLITGTIVVTEEGTKPKPWAVMVRALCRLLSLEMLTFLSSMPRGWHDSASDTHVIDYKKYKEIKRLKLSFQEIGNEGEVYE